MTANFSFITHATQCHADIFPVRCTCDGLTKRGFADSRRADETQNRCLDLVDPLLDGKIFKDAFLDPVQTIVIVFQYLFGIGKIVVYLGFFSPWQGNERFDVIAHDSRFRRHRRHDFQFFEFRESLVTGFFRHLGQSDFLFKILKISPFLAFAQFALDRLDLFIQVVFTL